MTTSEVKVFFFVFWGFFGRGDGGGDALLYVIKEIKQKRLMYCYKPPNAVVGSNSAWVLNLAV